MTKPVLACHPSPRPAQESVGAAPGQTLIGQRIFAATEQAVETTPVGSLELKGFGRPAVAYEVRRLR